MYSYRLSFLLLALLGALSIQAHSAESLPFDVVFKGKSRYDQIVSDASKVAPTLAAMPIGDRVAYFGKKLVGTPYKGYTLEVHTRIEAPVVNLVGLDCWTFFETALAFARMADRPPAEWSPQLLRKYIELDRYWAASAMAPTPPACITWKTGLATTNAAAWCGISPTTWAASKCAIRPSK